MTNKWKGYKPGSKEAKEAAERYKPPPTIKEPGEERRAPRRPPVAKEAEEALAPSLLAKPELPPGKREVTPEGYIRVTQNLGRGRTQMSVWRKTDDGYVQIGGPAGQAFIPTTPGPQLREALAGISDLAGRTQFERAVELQLIPPGSQYVPGEDGAWGYLTPKQVKERAGAKQALAAFKRDHIQLGDKRWMKKEDYYSLSPDDRAILQEKGFAGLQAAKEADRAKVKVALRDYTTDKGTNLARYLRDHPGDTKTLRAAGFEQADIAEAIEYNKQPHILTTPMETWWQKVKEADGAGLNVYEFQDFLKEHPNLAKEGREALLAPAPKPTKPKVSLDQFTAEFMEARGIKPIGATGIALTKEQQEAKQLAMLQYGRTYGAKELAKSGGAAGAALLFAPARALYPEVELKDITPMDWGVGAAQVALLASPLITAPFRAVGALNAAKFTGIGLRGASGLMFTAATAKNWNEMGEGERVLAVCIDTVVLGSAVLGAVPKPGARFKTLTGKVIDTSAKVSGSKKVKDALKTIGDAIKADDVKMLREGGKQLELAAADVPPQLGGGILAARGRLIASNPKQFLKLNKGKFTAAQAEDIQTSLKGNRSFIENAERALRRVKDPAKKKAIEEALKTARKQVAVATKVRVKPLLNWEELGKGKYPLAKVPTKAGKPAAKGKPSPKVKITETRIKESAFPGIKPKTKVEVTTKDGRSIAIPSEAFGRMTAAQIAKHYGVDEEALVWAVAATSPATQSRIQEQAATREQVAPYPVPQPMVKPAEQPQPVVRQAEQVKITEKTKPEPGMVTPFPLPTPTPTPEPLKKPPQKPRLRLAEEEKKPEPKASERPGSIAWRQGKFWVKVEPPFRGEKPSVSYSEEPPAGAKILKGDPLETFFTKGEKLPDQVKMAMGAFNVTISPGGVPKLRFRRAL